MAQDTRKLVDVLKGELEFLKEGGYRRASGSSWRPQLVFEDSGTCLNQNLSTDRRPCWECVLMQLVPEDRRQEKAPCRHIRLSQSGETLDSLYRTASREETEAIVGKWLITKIKELEQLETKKSRLPGAPATKSDGRHI
ncbi:MAG TPA: hypothetical protein VN822_06580 [Candidatus Acidoferrales bacterium]|nr:hypothetical protein [Candidatus Acidoferrales bacterium]